VIKIGEEVMPAVSQRLAIFYDNLAQVKVAKGGDLDGARRALTTAFHITEKACGKGMPPTEQARQLMLNPPQVNENLTPAPKP
jgi:hypothetical protein